LKINRGEGVEWGLKVLEVNKILFEFGTIYIDDTVCLIEKCKTINRGTSGCAMISCSRVLSQPGATEMTALAKVPHCTSRVIQEAIEINLRHIFNREAGCQLSPGLEEAHPDN
jgi:hypothetical protein